ncbi:hypothetical protein AB4Y44_28095 [Paraburkholderia sp. BR10937]|uniref:hypothetical protein n=1 Tax=Paraburkholderia sp. BR10937 TaxID=3236994 RepID=UPI0034D36183
MFSLGVLKTLKENTAIAMLPLLAIAIFSDVPFQGSPEASAATNLVVHAVLAIAAAIIAPVLFDNALFILDRYLPEDAIFGFAAFLLTIFCLCGVTLLNSKFPHFSLNPAWYLSAGCYAFFLRERNALFASIRRGAR